MEEKKKERKPSQSVWKTILNYFPLLTVLLIFFGYCHLHFFYCSQFDIDIYQFITSGEIALSFLPIAFVLFLLLIIAGFIFIVVDAAEEEKTEHKPKKPKYIPFTRLLISTGKTYGWFVYAKLYARKHWKKKFKEKIYLLYKKISHINFLAVLGWAYFTYYLSTNNFLHEDIVAGILISGGWLIIFFNLIKRQFHLKVGSIYKKNYKKIYTGCIFVLGFLLVDYLFMYYKAEGIKNGTNRSSIAFQYEGKEINTFKDTTLLYVGATQQYIFIYNAKDKNKHLYDKIKATNIVFGERHWQLVMHFNVDSIKIHPKLYCDSIRKYNHLIKDPKTKKMLMNLCDSLQKENIILKDTLSVKKDTAAKTK